MKILAINGSPNREGATSELIDVLLEECTRLGATCDKVNIEDYSILPCQECYKCSQKRMCIIDDDFIQLKARILDADGIIIGSPYYSGKPVEHLEVFTNRASFCAFSHKEFEGKFFVGVSTSAVDDGSNVAGYCANLGYVGARGGYQVSGLIWEPTITDEGVKEVKEDELVRENASKIAKNLINDIKLKERVFKNRAINMFFPGWLNLCLVQIKRKKDFYTNRLYEYLREKGLVKNT